MDELINKNLLSEKDTDSIGFSSIALLQSVSNDQQVQASFLSIYFSTFLIILKIAIISISTFLNFLIICIILTRRETRVYINYIILSICLSDFLFGIISVSFWSAYSTSIYSSFLSYKYSCTFWAINDYCTMCINLLNSLQILCYEYRRISLISSPIRNHESSNFQKLTKLRLLSIVCTWLITYVYTALSTYSLTINYDINPENCVNNYSLLMDSYLFSLPILTLFILNVSMISLYVYKNENSLMSIQANQIEVRKEEENVGSLFQNEKYYLVANQDDLENDLSSVFRPDSEIDTLKSCEKKILKIAKIFIILTFVWILMLPLWQMSSLCVDCILYEICKIGYCIAFLCSNMNPILILIFNKKIYNELKLILRAINLNV